jgi:hypothetical protein
MLTLNFKIDASVLELAPGTQGQLQLTLINDGMLQDYFQVTLQGVDRPDSEPLDPAWVAFSRTQVTLRPPSVARVRTGRDPDPQQDETSEEVQIFFSIPPQARAGTYSGALSATSGTGAYNNLEIPITLVISQLTARTFKLEPTTQTSRRGTAIFQVQLANQGNLSELYPVYGEDDQNECQIEAVPPEIELGPGARANLTLKVRPLRRNWWEDDKTYQFKTVLEGYQQEIFGSFTQRCALPPLHWLLRRWRSLALALVIVTAILVAALVFLVPRFFPPTLACGVLSSRTVEVASNGQTTTIYVSNPGGSFAAHRKPVVTVGADALPGLFASLVSISADGRRLAYITARNPALDGANLMMLELDNPNAKPELLQTIPSGLWPVAPVWAADGQHLAYVRQGGGNNASPTTNAATPQSSLTPAPVGGLQVWTIQWNLNSTTRLWEKQPLKQANSELFPEIEKLKPENFYGYRSSQNPALCWSADNRQLLLNPVNLNSEHPLTKALAEKAAIPSDCAVKNPYSQHDPRWSENRLSLKPGATERLADYGCPLVGAAMLLNFYGSGQADPDKLLNCLQKSEQASPLFEEGWASIGEACNSGSNLQVVERGDFSWQSLDAALQQGPALVGLLGGQTGTHFVVVNYGRISGLADTYAVTDPWDGTTHKTLGYFLDKGYFLRWLVKFSPQGRSATCGPDQETTPQDLSAKLNLQAPLKLQDGGLYQSLEEVRYRPGISQSVKYYFQDPNNPPGLPNEYNLVLSRPFEPSGNYLFSDVYSRTNGTISDTLKTRLVVDNLKPEIKAVPNIQPDLKDNNKYKAPVRITLQAFDTLSGIALIEYQIVSAPKDPYLTNGWRRYNSDTTPGGIPVLVDNGTYTLRYRATDGAGNTSKEDGEERILNIEIPAQLTNPGMTAPTPTPLPSPTPFTDNPPPPARPTATNTPRPVATATATRTAIPAGRTPAPSPGFGDVSGIRGASPTPLPGQAQLRLEALPLQLVFQPGLLSQTVTISNTGTAAFSWELLPGSSENLLEFQLPAVRKLEPKAQVSFSVNLLNAELLQQARSASFRLVANGGNFVEINVSISPVPLPTARFVLPDIGELLPDTTIKLEITAPEQSRPADHAVILATYKSCADCPAASVVLPNKPSPANNWTISWNTRNLFPQTGLSLQGKLCVSSDDSLCSPIAPLANLFISSGAKISAPLSGSLLADQTTIKIETSGRVEQIILSPVYQDGGSPVEPSPVRISGTTNFSWNTTKIIPGKTVILRGKVCSTADNSQCQELGEVTGLFTRMNASLVFGQDLTANKKLPLNLEVNVSNPSGNIDHISLYATYQEAGENVASRKRLSNVNLRGDGTTPWKGSWNTGGLPIQTKISLEAFACFYNTESLCTALGDPYTDLEIATSSASNLTAFSGTGQSTLISTTFSYPLQVLVRDNRNNPVSGITVTFQISSTEASAVFSGTNTALTGADGIATSARLTANNFAGKYSVNATATGLNGVASFQLTNNNPQPIISALSPRAVLVTSPGFTLRVNGSNFARGAVVYWNGDKNPRPTTYVSATQLDVAIPASDLSALATAAITVFNPGPGGGSSTPAVIFRVNLGVGDGTAASCNEAAFDAALAAARKIGGGTITFDCPNPTTINLTTAKIINFSLGIDGGTLGAITLSGGGVQSHFSVLPGFTFNLQNITLSDGNAGSGPGGAIYNNGGTLNLYNSSFKNNLSSNLGGGVIFNSGNGKVNITNCTFINNLAQGTNGYGGAIYNRNGTLNITGSNFSANSADELGGAIYNYQAQSTVITGSTFISNVTNTWGGAIYSYGPLSSTGSTFSDNQAVDAGGAIYSIAALSISDSKFSANRAGYSGGAIYQFSIYDGLKINKTSFSTNRAGNYGGAIAYGDSVVITSSTFSENSADYGAALFNYSNQLTSSTIANSTFYKNIANFWGGAFYDLRYYYNSLITISNSTFAYNNASYGATFYSETYTNTLTLKNSIVANDQNGSNCNEPIINGGNNLQWPNGSCGDSIRIDNPLLSNLADNGGPTLTVALLAGSPAINSGNNAVCASPPVNGVDQRGVARPIGTACDVGAFESPLGNSVTPTPTPSPSPTISPSPTVTPTSTVIINLPGPTSTPTITPNIGPMPPPSPTLPPTQSPTPLIPGVTPGLTATPKP